MLLRGVNLNSQHIDSLQKEIKTINKINKEVLKEHKFSSSKPSNFQTKTL